MIRATHTFKPIEWRSPKINGFSAFSISVLDVSSVSSTARIRKRRTCMPIGNNLREFLESEESGSSSESGSPQRWKEKVIFLLSGLCRISIAPSLSSLFSFLTISPSFFTSYPLIHIKLTLSSRTEGAGSLLPRSNVEANQNL